MNTNHARRILKEGRNVVGTMLSGFCSEEVLPLIAQAGFDFVVIDTEHQPLGAETVARLIRYAREYEVAPVVRVTDNQYSMIARALDVGALGVMVPRVDTVDQARKAIAAVKYPPQGRRGYGLREPSKNYQTLSVPETIEWSNENTLVILQVESQESLDNLDRIACLPGVDVLLIGPMDLSISLGVPGQLDHEKMQKAFHHVIQCAQRHGVAGGAHFPDAQGVLRWEKEGMRAMLCASDIRIMGGALGTLGAQLGRDRRERGSSAAGGLY